MVAPALPLPVREALLDALAVLLPVDCAGCGAADRAACPACRSALAADPVLRGVRDLPVWSALRYEGVVRAAILALKEHGRTDVAGVLGAALRAAAARAVAGAPDAEFCAVPSSRSGRRRRGYDPVRMIAARGGIPLVVALRTTRSGAVQKSLGVSGREANAVGSLRAARRVEGRRFVLVDDVVTTGSTLLEARRALVEAGAEVVGAAVLASTPRHRPIPTERGGGAQTMPGDTGAGAD